MQFYRNQEELALKQEWIEKIYAGWLGKVIGIRLGAPIEGWTYEKIRAVYGELDRYPVDYRDFAADDDSNVPLFFLRALEDGKHGFDLQAGDVAEALLNYAPFERGFFWWGGYGISTEHTAYLNLRNGIPAPRSGSVEQNGAAMAEQIGGQIFIDTWGLVNPGNPDRAAKFAEHAASVTHGGNGVYGGIFIAVCISTAFVEQDMTKILEKGLSYLPADCEYTRVVRAVMEFHQKHPDHWRDCFQYIYENFGYDKYPGACHIIPNIAVMILSLLYGGGDFSDTLTICNMCGWDTDCNVGNVGTILGVRNGLEGIDHEKWRAPIHDFLVCSSTLGSRNLMDLPYGASFIGRLAYALAGEQPPEPWKELWENRIDSCHFEYPGSTHDIRVRRELTDPQANQQTEAVLTNSTETAHSGSRSLKAVVKPVGAGERVCLYKKTYCYPRDFHDSRYDPSFSPLCYPGQTVHASVFLPEYGPACQASVYVHDARQERSPGGEPVLLEPGRWTELSYAIPGGSASLIDEVGVRFELLPGAGQEFAGFLDDLWIGGKPDYRVELSREQEEVWGGNHREISQFSKLKGLSYLEQGELHLSCSDFGELYTGHHSWEDYEAVFAFTPLTGEWHGVNVRVQGAVRSYAAALLPGGKAALLKNENGYRTLAEAEFPWKPGREVTVRVTVRGGSLEAAFEGGPVLSAEDSGRVWHNGCIGLSVREGSHMKCRLLSVRGL